MKLQQQHCCTVFLFENPTTIIPLSKPSRLNCCNVCAASSSEVRLELLRYRFFFLSWRSYKYFAGITTLRPNSLLQQPRICSWHPNGQIRLRSGGHPAGKSWNFIIIQRGREQCTHTEVARVSPAPYILILLCLFGNSDYELYNDYPPTAWWTAVWIFTQQKL